MPAGQMCQIVIMLMEDRLSPMDILLTSPSPLVLFNELQQTEIKHMERQPCTYGVVINCTLAHSKHAGVKQTGSEESPKTWPEPWHLMTSAVQDWQWKTSAIFVQMLILNDNVISLKYSPTEDEAIPLLDQ